MNPKVKLDLGKAGAAVDAYVAAITDPSIFAMPARISTRSWIEGNLVATGVISDIRLLAFGESHAIWYACLVVTNRLREVSRLEASKNLVRRPGGSTENTVRKLLKPGSMIFGSVTGEQLRAILTSPAILPLP